MTYIERKPHAPPEHVQLVPGKVRVNRLCPTCGFYGDSIYFNNINNNDECGFCELPAAERVFGMPLTARLGLIEIEDTDTTNLSHRELFKYEKFPKDATVTLRAGFGGCILEVYFITYLDTS